MKNNLKKIALALAVVLGGAMAQAWDWTSYCEALEGNRWIVKAGVGYGYSLVNMDHGVKGAAGGFALPIQGEFLLGKIPLGITLDFRPMWGKYSGMKTSSIALMAGANYHVSPGPKWLDLYAGMEMGFFYSWLEYEFSYIEETEKLKGAGFAFGAHVGASFFFTKHFGVNAEVGYPTLVSASAAFTF